MRTQNKSRSGWKDTWFRGSSKSQFNSCDQIPHDGWGFHSAGARYSPHQTSGPTVPTMAPFGPPSQVTWCEICEVKLPSFKYIEEHKNAKRHQRMLILHEASQRQNDSNGQQIRQMPNSQMNLVVQPKTVLKSDINGCQFENMISEATIAKHENNLRKDIRLNSEVPAEGPEGEPRGNFGARGHGFKRKIGGATGVKYMKTNNGIRKSMDSSKPVVQVPAVAPLPGPVAPTPVAGSSLELQFQHVSASQTQASKGKEKHEIQNPTVETNDQPQSISVESHAPAGSNINTQTEDVSSSSATIAIAPPKEPMASQVFAPPPAVGSSLELKIQHVLQMQVSESKEHHKIQNPTGETIDQPESISVELHAPAGSDINTQTEEMSSDSAAITVPPPKGRMGSDSASQVFAPPAGGSSFEPQSQHVLLTQVLEGKEHHEIQNPNGEMNDQPQSISVELHAPAGSNINTHIGDVSSDSAAIAIAPLEGPMPFQVLASAQAVGSSFEPQIQHVLHTETEPQVSEAISHYESQNPTDKSNNQLLPSVLVEFDGPSGSNSNTQTADGNSKAEEKMDGLATELGITQLSQATVCLKCGDEGFPETLVFCNTCQVYALHRYCLDGPVIFVDDVTWYCEDCEANIIDTYSHDRCTPLPCGTSDSVNSAKDATQARKELTNCTQRVKENKQRQNANSSKGYVTVADPQPIADPIWRGSLGICNQGFGTVSGLLAHMSNLACSKVLKEARLFPEVLCGEFVQRSAVWPKCFMEHGTNKESIALYFFPENERVESDFDKLVDDMIDLDLAIRVVLENAELLVYASTVLPVLYRRFQAKYFMWGVFRAKQTSPETNGAGCGKDTSFDKPSDGSVSDAQDSCASSH